MHRVTLAVIVVAGLLGCASPADVALFLPNQDSFMHSSFVRVLAYDVEEAEAGCAALIGDVDVGSIPPAHDTGLQPVCSSLEGANFGSVAGRGSILAYDPFGGASIEAGPEVAYVAVYYERDEINHMLTGCTIEGVGEPVDLHLAVTTWYDMLYRTTTAPCPSAEDYCSYRCD